MKSGLLALFCIIALVFSIVGCTTVEGQDVDPEQPVQTTFTTQTEEITHAEIATIATTVTTTAATATSATTSLPQIITTAPKTTLPPSVVDCDLCGVNVGALCEECELRIREDWLKFRPRRAFEEFDVDNVPINYFGTYNGSVAAIIGADSDMAANFKETVAGVLFQFPMRFRVWIWNNGKFHALSTRDVPIFGYVGELPEVFGWEEELGAYDLGLVTKQDIENIKELCDNIDWRTFHVM